SDLSDLSRRRHRRFLFLIAVLTGLAGLSWWGTRSLPPAEPRAVGDSGNTASVSGQTPSAAASAPASVAPLANSSPTPSLTSAAVPVLWRFAPRPAVAAAIEVRAAAPTRE